MLRDNDLLVPGADHKHDDSLNPIAASNFDNSQWGGLSHHLVDPSKFTNQESMTNILFVGNGHQQSPASAGSGMIGNPAFMNSGSSSSSSINEYANSFLTNFNDGYNMYDGYSQHFNGHGMHQQQLITGHDPSLLQYTNPGQPEMFDSSSFGQQSTNSYDRDTLRKDKPYLTASEIQQNNNLVPPSAIPPTDHQNDQDHFNSVPSGGMGGFVGSWSYESNNPSSIPLSMMHSPLRGNSSGQHIPFTMQMSNDPNQLPPPPHFIQPGEFQFPSQLYSQPQLHESDPSNFSMGDPSFMMFYGSRLEDPNASNGSINNPNEIMNSSSSINLSMSKTNSSERRRPPVPTNATNRTARTARGQVMVLKDSGDMIAEPDDEVASSDSPYRNSVPRRYMCSVCSKRFTRPSTLRTHMNSHTGERPYHCPTKGCDWKFTVLSNLKRHMRICNGMKRGSSGELEGNADADWKP
ncbi:UNVERIFIED_CONTAM: hypothetical protein HDU68_008252 [Siphonaria sp. JEL0065]|nr:hypothetical protein HDU68_008252 [Siphonaria sp. JEL0065]